MSVTELHSRFEKNWRKYFERGLENAKSQGKTEQDFQENPSQFLPKHSLLRALNDTFFYQWWGAAVWKVISDSSQATAPLLTRRLIEFVALKDVEPVGKGIGYALGITALFLVNCFFLHQFFYYSMLTGAQVNAVLSHALYLKSLKLSDKSRLTFTNGKITNLLSTDCHRVEFALQWIHFAWTFPVSLAICLVVVLTNIGAPGLVGFAFLFVSLLGVAVGGKILGDMRKKVNKITDSRVSMMREILQSMKVIKFYSWEEPYLDWIISIRNNEMSRVMRMLTFRNGLNAIFVAAPTFAGLFSFILMARVGKYLNPATVFSSLTTFNIIRMPLVFLPLSIITGTEAFLAIKRIQACLTAPEAVDYLQFDYESEHAVDIIDGEFIWEKEDSDEPEAGTGKQLSPSVDTDDEKTEKKVEFSGFFNLDLKIKKGEFIMITGSIGSGKSSLLSAIAGMMKKEQGSVTLGGDISFCGPPWIHNATVEENITFGRPKNYEWYKTVIKACSLSRDFEILPAGDQTEVGERGITLSGGQKARINLARAVYWDASIVLLDDVLSAVDAHVGKYIMENCFLDLLYNKTRVLATHQLSMLDYADRIIYLDGTGQAHVGTISELERTIPDFKHLLSFRASATYNEEEEKEDEKNEEEEEEAEKTLQRIQTIKSRKSEKTNDDGDEEGKKKGKLMVDEDRAKNSVSWDVYKTFIKFGGGVFSYGIIPILVSAIVLSVFTQLFTNTWLSFWTGNKFKGRTENFYIGIFVMFTLLTAIFSFIFFWVLTKLGNSSSAALHKLAIKRIIHAPMTFFDTSPSGRILNRFTKDTDTMDNEMSDQARLFLLGMSTVIGVFILIIIYLPYFAIALVVLFVFFVIIAVFYRASAREIKRMDSTARSVVFSHFSETLNGISVIKAYKSQERFIKRNESAIDRKDSALFLTLVNQRWLALRLDLIGVVLTLVVTLLCATGVFNINASSVGLVLSSLLQIAGMLSLTVREFATVENNMNSVERVYHYAYNVEQEAPYYIEENKPRESWPEVGQIEMSNVTMSYQPDLPAVLKGINLSINPGEKIGICGRTGAGKSSIMVALYRMSELTDGKMLIDGVDISQIGLHDLRSNLAIIPQDPVLFQGTVRSNIDPFNKSTDIELWDALRRSWLVDTAEVENMKQMNNQEKPSANNNNMPNKFHLDSKVDDEGSNFSLGERQLLALTRALVRKSPILILDEATSSVDYETDSKIQETIGKDFSDCTILCIAHRLRTILSYDRILVLDSGEVKEFDSPLTLFDKQDGLFRAMCEQSGIVREDISN